MTHIKKEKQQMQPFPALNEAEIRVKKNPFSISSHFFALPSSFNNT